MSEIVLMDHKKSWKDTIFVLIRKLYKSIRIIHQSKVNAIGVCNGGAGSTRDASVPRKTRKNSAPRCLFAFVLFVKRTSTSRPVNVLKHLAVRASASGTKRRRPPTTEIAAVAARPPHATNTRRRTIRRCFSEHFPTENGAKLEFSELDNFYTLRPICVVELKPALVRVFACDE